MFSYHFYSSRTMDFIDLTQDDDETMRHKVSLSFPVKGENYKMELIIYAVLEEEDDRDSIQNFTNLNVTQENVHRPDSFETPKNAETDHQYGKSPFRLVKESGESSYIILYYEKLPNGTKHLFNKIGTNETEKIVYCRCINKNCKKTLKIDVDKKIVDVIGIHNHPAKPFLL